MICVEGLDEARRLSVTLGQKEVQLREKTGEIQIQILQYSQTSVYQEE